MTVEEAFAKAEEQLSHCTYLAETSTKPGIGKINSNKARWLSLLLFYAKKGLRDQQEHKWIPVSKRLPDEDTRVLVWLLDDANKYTRMDTDRRHNGKWVRWEKYVTHWMPLPQTPKGE